MAKGLIEGLLVGQVEAGGRDQRDPGLIQRLRKNGTGPPVDAAERVALDEQLILQLVDRKACPCLS